jgi:hypothetical protein
MKVKLEVGSPRGPHLFDASRTLLLFLCFCTALFFRGFFLSCQVPFTPFPLSLWWLSSICPWAMEALENFKKRTEGAALQQSQRYSEQPS